MAKKSVVNPNMIWVEEPEKHAHATSDVQSYIASKMEISLCA